MVEQARRADATPDCIECGASHVFVGRSGGDAVWQCYKCSRTFDAAADYRAGGAGGERDVE